MNTPDPRTIEAEKGTAAQGDEAARTTLPLHHPITVELVCEDPNCEHVDEQDQVDVCSHCWDIMLVLAPDYPAEKGLPDFLIWPCPSAERTLDMAMAMGPDDDMIEGVARCSHAIGELDYPDDERVPFEELEDEDAKFLLFESRVWLRAMATYVGVRSGLIVAREEEVEVIS